MILIFHVPGQCYGLYIVGPSLTDSSNLKAQLWLALDLGIPRIPQSWPMRFEDFSQFCPRVGLLTFTQFIIPLAITMH